MAGLAPGASFPQMPPVPALSCLDSALCNFAALFPSFFPFCALVQPALLNASKPGDKMVGAGDERAYN